MRPDGIPYTAPSRAGFAPRPLAPAPAVGGGNPVYTAGAADTAPSPYAPSASAARPAPVPAAPSAAPYNPQAPSKSVYAYSERQQLYAALPWRPAGGGLRFSRDVPLRTLPPGEPIYIEMFVHNQGNAPLATTYYIFLTNANLQGTKLQAESFDIPAGSVLDVSHTLAANLQPGEYHITVFCVPRTTRGRLQDPAVFPTLGPVDSSLPSGFPSLYEVLKIRTEVPCPNCGGRLLWTPAGVGGRPRAWVCGRCGNRVESGVA